MLEGIKKIKSRVRSHSQKRREKGKHIASVAMKSGWDKTRAEREMAAARDNLGVSYALYDKYDFYLLSEEEQKKKFEAIKKKREKNLEKRNKCIDNTIKKTGWDKKKASDDVDKARKKYGISYLTYDKYDFCLQTEEDRDRLIEEIKITKKNKKRCAAALVEKYGYDEKKARKTVNLSRKKCIDSIMKETGWPKEKAREAMEEAVGRVGISYKELRLSRLIRLDPAEQEEEYRKQQARKKETQEILDKRIQQAQKRTGWNREKVLSEIEKDRSLTGCNLREWFFYKFDELSPEEKKSLFLHKQHNRIRERYPYADGLKKILESKELTNRYFSDFITRPWCINTEVSEDEFISLFQNSKGVVYKPVYGLQGREVEAFYFDDYQKKQLYQKLATFPKGVVEEIVIQHSILNKLNPGTVNTMRVVTVSSFSKQVTEQGDNVDIAFATLKIGGGDSIADNLHTGGVCAAVDRKTGVLITDGVDYEGNAHVVHPNTHAAIKGTQLPFVKEALDLVITACKQLKLEGVIGWDIAFSEAGPVVIEPNASPDPILANAPFGPEHKGLRKEMEKYLWEDKEDL